MTLRGGLDLGGTKIEAIVVDEAHEIRGQARRLTPTDGGPPAVVAELATAMRGRVTVTSTPGHGSVFTLELEPAPVPDHSAYARLTQR